VYASVSLFERYVTIVMAGAISAISGLIGAISKRLEQEHL
jgi:hypothetical protein